MNAAPNESAAAVCGYCGRENPERLPACTNCGNPLVSAPPPQAETEPGRKSKAIAVGLALAFGPLGLLYARAYSSALIVFVVAAPFILTRTGGVWLAIGSRILCAIWAYCTVVEQDEAPNDDRDSTRLLNAAARLENVDRLKAIAAYEEIIRLYPETPASRESERNIQTLKKSNGIGT